MKEITFHLEAFDGPLDLLLHLLSKNKVNICDIPISLILEQYLKYIDNMREFDMDVAADFISMAAQLMYIKSKMLLPVYEEEQDDPRAALVEALMDYQRFKEAGTLLNDLSELGKDLYIKSPEPLERGKAIEYSYDSDVLIKTIKDILERGERKLPPPASAFQGIVGREAVPVNDKIELLVRLFSKNKNINFNMVVLDCKNRSEVVAVFLAVLELSKNRKILIEDGENGYILSLAGE